MLRRTTLERVRFDQLLVGVLVIPEPVYLNPITLRQSYTTPSRKRSVYFLVIFPQFSLNV